MPKTYNKFVMGDTTYLDLSNDTVTADKLLAGYTAHDKNGELIVGTAEGGGGGSASNLVKFIDYDGTILHSYSVSDFMALDVMPSNPTYSGLTSQGWNWSLADAKTQLTEYPEVELIIGQMYITDDGKTRLYVHFEEGRLHPYLGICPKGTVVVDWGDNSPTSILNGTSLTTVKHADHEYPSAGDYVITLIVSSGSFAFYGVSNTSHILKKNTQTTANINRVYTNCIKKVEVGANATIGNYAFNNCYSLASITIPEGITSIGKYAFNNCYSLASITIPEGITSIGNNMFQYCYSLVSITIPEGITSIGNNMFQYCYSLASITIPEGITSIGSNAFSSCYSLASITIPEGITSIGSNAFNNCYSLASITIPEGITSIGSNAFSSCYALVSITIPEGITSIGNNMFQYCYSLASITIPEGITSIGDYAFSSCYALASITIPEGITSIGSNAFQYCYGMSEYHFLSTTPPALSNTNAFTNIQSDCTIYVPAASLTTYQEATNWSTYANYMIGE